MPDAFDPPPPARVLTYADGELVDVQDDRVLEDERARVLLEAKARAGRLLERTDWYALRQAERGVTVPSSIAAHRAAVLAAVDAAEAAASSASDLAALDSISWDADIRGLEAAQP